MRGSAETAAGPLASCVLHFAFPVLHFSFLPSPRRPVPSLSPVPSLASLLTDLASPDDDHLRTTLRAAATHLRTASPEDRAALGERVLPLLDRRSPRVREGVADLADLLPEPLADTILAALLVDSEHYVRRAAERASTRRKGRQTAQAREDEQERVLGRILGRVESKAGKPVRRLAERAAQLALESFVRKLHHELRKAIMPLEFALHHVGVEMDKPQIDKVAVKRHIKNAWDLVAFSKSILSAAAACSSTITPTFEEEGLAAIVDEARKHLLDRLGPRARRVAFTNDVDPKLRIEVDKHLLLQALQNVLQNAEEAYASDAERVDIAASATLQRNRSELVLALTDRGRGMTEDQIARAFVPFGSSKPDGTGVGMLIVRRMVEEVHGGTVAITSRPGTGTTVALTLPLGLRGGGR